MYTRSSLFAPNTACRWGDDSSWIQVDIHATADGSGFVLELDRAELVGKTITGVKYETTSVHPKPAIYFSLLLFRLLLTCLEKLVGRYGQGIPGMIPQSGAQCVVEICETTALPSFLYCVFNACVVIGHKRVCCGTRDITLNPCPPASCPITSVKGELPAMPFMASITKSGDCEGKNSKVGAGNGKALSTRVACHVLAL